MDLVYIVRPGDDNEELRYSLRSVVNLPHDNVWIVGHCPEWVRNTGRLELEPHPVKWDNINQSLAAACADERISDWFVLMADDMFITEPLAGVPVVHVGLLPAVIAEQAADGETREKNSYFGGLVETYVQLVEWGLDAPLCYEAHTPLPFNRRELGSLLERATRYPILWGCLYAATSGPVGELGDNSKISDLGPGGLLHRMIRGGPCLSTEDDSFELGVVGDYIRNLFPDPGPYEEAS